MTKRAADLSFAELSVFGAEAAQRAAARAYGAGLSVAGTINVIVNGRVVEKLLECSPSGELTDLKILGFSDCVDT